LNTFLLLHFPLAMPKRRDLESVLVIGSGPIVIGQACEFDYSGTQACRALREEGIRVVLVNSNPATIMTDPDIADATYIEPISPKYIEAIIQKEKPTAILPTVGGQTALNAAMELHKLGILEKYGVELIGSKVESIEMAENREEFLAAMQRCGLEMPVGGFVSTMEEGVKMAESIGTFPIIIRPSFTLGGTGGGTAWNWEDFKQKLEYGLQESPIHRVLVEESIIGWKEYELEVMRDTKDNVVIVCSIENFDPMGVHTGDSITVAPAQTLTDREYQLMRDAAIKIMREIGVETGGSNVQFAVNPQNGRLIIIEMNPRVSRSSALASKATGFPIAKIAAKLAVGYTLDEITNDITGATPACFEPTIDYVVTKVPRWDFEKFKGVEDELGVQMKSVGEAMAFGRTFKESFQKALRSLEKSRYGFGFDSAEYLVPPSTFTVDKEILGKRLFRRKSDSIFDLCEALRMGLSTDHIRSLTGYDPWFIEQCREIVNAAQELLRERIQWEDKQQVDEQTLHPRPLGEGLAPSSERGVRENAQTRQVMLPPQLLEKARAMRINSTEAEALLWSLLRDKQLLGLKFRRQHVLGNYIADFYCHEALLVIELDGSGHAEQQQKNYDEERTQFLASLGINVMRFWNHDVLKKTTAVLEAIVEAANQKVDLFSDVNDLKDPHPAPLPEGEGVRRQRSSSFLHTLTAPRLKRLKFMGFSDRQLAVITGASESEVRTHRLQSGIRPVFKTIDTCAAEFESHTPYHYSTYEQENESVRSERRKVVILGGGPNRIGQGIEFDYCCVQGIFAVKQCGFEAIMINCNPETVSTDYDIADKLYFEPLTLEDVLNILEFERPDGVIVTFGGQTPLKLANAIEEAGFTILGTSPEGIDLAEDRKRFGHLLDELKMACPSYGTATSVDEAIAIANRIGYPVLVRPSYVLGGRAMQICFRDESIREYMARAIGVSPEKPILIDHFLENAYEFDVDAVSDGERVVIGGVMQHIEEAGIHSGDSSCVLPPYNITNEQFDHILDSTRRLAKALNVVGLMNIQFALQGDDLYVIEVNPRASRTVPFVSKARGVALAQIATRVMLGQKFSSAELPHIEDFSLSASRVAIKESVFPFNKFPKANLYLGPEMRSTGEVMGIDADFASAVVKANISAGHKLPQYGRIFASLCDRDKTSRAAKIIHGYHELGFEIVATKGTATWLEGHKIPATPLLKYYEGSPNVLDSIEAGDIQMVINTPKGENSRYDEVVMGRAAMKNKVPFFTTLAAAQATLRGLRYMRLDGAVKVKSLQEYYTE
jgi:carbamoyl-phosphate synthase large subunit